MQGRLTRPTLWHLHGSVDDAANIVLTPDGYKQLYVQERYRAALSLLRAVIAGGTFLFVGFSLSDVHFVDQVRWVHEAFQGCTGPHYALFEKSEAAQIEREIQARSLPVQIVRFDGFGQPLLDVLTEISSHAPCVCG
jgi:hypothetical protein